ncbi:unnamed protein product [Closterium sp. NIES-65]|nr:unnamed protein product [Closterium sp. NIES-65]
MVHLTELRIVLPFTCACQGPGAERDATGRAHGGEGGGVRGCAVEEFKRGQRYANWRTNEDATEPGQGGTLLSSTPYYHEQHGEGLFTHSLFRLGNRLPDWVNRLVPPSALVVDEKSWINYPYFRTIITIPFFSKDGGSFPNAFGLPHFPTPFSSLEKILPFPHFPTPFSSLEKILPFPHFPTPFSSLEKILPFPHFPTPFSSLEKILPFPHFPTPFSSLEKILPLPPFPTTFLLS